MSPVATPLTSNETPLTWWAERRQSFEKFQRLVPLFPWLVALAFGIAWQAAMHSPLLIMWIALIAFGLLGGVFVTRRKRLLSCATLGIALVAWGAIHYEFQRTIEEPDALAKRVSTRWEPVVAEVVVRDTCRLRPAIEFENDVERDPQKIPRWQTIIPVLIVRVRDADQWISCESRALLTVDGQADDLLPGDRLKIFGKIQSLGSSRNPGQPDLKLISARRGEHVRLRLESAAHMTRIESGGWGWGLKRMLAATVAYSNKIIHNYVGNRQGPMAAALILGQREQVRPDLRDALLATGTIHLLSISGLHVEMVAMSILTLGLICRLPRRTTLFTVGALVLYYAMLTGSNPPVIRATILVIGFAAARWLGRAAMTLNLLSLGAICLLIYQPTLLFDLGTQLSFLAVATLVLVGRPTVQPHIRQPEEELESKATRTMRGIRKWFTSGIRSSLGVWLTTTPLVLFHFHVVSFVAIVLNLLLWLPILVALLSGLLLLIVGDWLPPLSYLIGALCAFSLESAEWLIVWGERIPAGHGWFPTPSIAWLISSYILMLLLAVAGWHRIANGKWAAALLTLWIFAGCLPGWIGPQGHLPLGIIDPLVTSNTGTLRITFIDVGHGTSVAIQAPSGNVLLYDAGRLSDQQLGQQIVSGVLWEMGVARIDHLLLSHADSDHYSAMPGLLNRFSIGEFGSTSMLLSHPSPAIKSLRDKLQSQRIPFKTWKLGDQITWEGIDLEFLHPATETIEGADNAKSLCLQIAYGNRRILLLGDLESPGTEMVMQLPSPNADVVMAPHHGSLAEPPEPILRWSGADNVVISGAARSMQPKVLKAYRGSYRNTYVTARDGAVRVSILPNNSPPDEPLQINSAQMIIEHWNGSRWEPAIDREQ